MWAAADLLDSTHLYRSALCGTLRFLDFRIFHVLSLFFVELSPEHAAGHIHDTPAILLLLSLELCETDFDLDRPYRLPPP